MCMQCGCACVCPCVHTQDCGRTPLQTPEPLGVTFSGLSAWSLEQEDTYWGLPLAMQSHYHSFKKQHSVGLLGSPSISGKFLNLQEGHPSSFSMLWSHDCLSHYHTTLCPPPTVSKASRNAFFPHIWIYLSFQVSFW